MSPRPRRASHRGVRSPDPHTSMSRNHRHVTTGSGPWERLGGRMERERVVGPYATRGGTRIL